MLLKELEEIIVSHGGTIERGINWDWAIFQNDTTGKKVFVDYVSRNFDNRGYYEGHGFRYRPK